MARKVPERTSLIADAKRLVTLSEEGGSEFDRLLADFNARAGAQCDRRTFQFLHQSQEPAELVDHLLEVRDAPAFVAPRSRDELEAMLARAEADGSSWADQDRAGAALAAMSKLPYEVAHQLGSGFGTLPSRPSRGAIVDFALGYEPASTREELFALVRRWLEDARARRPSVYVAVGEELLRERHLALALSDLDRVVQRLASGVEAQRSAALARLATLSGLDAATP